MGATVCGLPIVFGASEIQIPGYTMHAKDSDWLLAEREGRLYFVADHGDHWVLHESGHNEESKSKSNPTGRYLDDRNPIHIVKLAG